MIPWGFFFDKIIEKYLKELQVQSSNDMMKKFLEKIEELIDESQFEFITIYIYSNGVFSLLKSSSLKQVEIIEDFLKKF